MKLFWGIATLLGLIVLAKASVYPLAEAVADQPVRFAWRYLLPLWLFMLGYCVFLLEGVQSSIMLANKQSAEALQRTFDNLDLTVQDRAKVIRLLNAYDDHKPIDPFLVGRQILIIVCAFLFKSVYDASSLTAYESQLLEKLAVNYPRLSQMVVATYQFLDSSWLSYFICSIAVAFVFQVTAKVMAQNYPMRFLITIPGALWVPLIAQVIGTGSLLARLLSRMRASGEKHANAGKHSYYHGKEVTQIDTEQTFTANSNDQCEAVNDVEITVTADLADHHFWNVNLRIAQSVLQPSQRFDFVLDSLPYNSIEFFALAYVGRERSELPALRAGVDSTSLIKADNTLRGLQDRLYARFGRVVPVGSEVIFDVTLKMPVRTLLEDLGAPEQYVFQHVISKATRRVSFCVEDDWSSDPVLHVSSSQGSTRPRSGKQHLSHANGYRRMHIEYPATNTRLEFFF